MLFSSTEFWNLIFGVVIKSFKIFLLVALSFLTSFNLSANDTFFSIEKKDTRVYDLANAGGDLYKSLSNVLKNSYDDLVAKGLRVVEEGNIIKFTDNTGNELAKIANNEFIPTKWTAYYKGEIVSKTETGHWLIKNGDEYGFDLVDLLHLSGGLVKRMAPLLTLQNGKTKNI